MLESYQIKGTDWTATCLKQLDDIIYLMNNKSEDYDKFIPKIRDSLKTFERSLKGTEWNKEIEKNWRDAKDKLANTYPKTDNGKILSRYLSEYIDAKTLLDFEYLVKMANDIGMIERLAAKNINGI